MIIPKLKGCTEQEFFAQVDVSDLTYSYPIACFYSADRLNCIGIIFSLSSYQSNTSPFIMIGNCNVDGYRDYNDEEQDDELELEYNRDTLPFLACVFYDRINLSNMGTLVELFKITFRDNNTTLSDEELDENLKFVTDAMKEVIENNMLYENNT